MPSLRVGDTCIGFFRQGVLIKAGAPVMPSLFRFKLWGVMFTKTFIGITRQIEPFQVGEERSDCVYAGHFPCPTPYRCRPVNRCLRRNPLMSDDERDAYLASQASVSPQNPNENPRGALRRPRQRTP